VSSADPADAGSARRPAPNADWCGKRRGAPQWPALSTDVKYLSGSTILTGWAQAVAETLAYAPERVLGLLADARPGGRWRAALKIAEPSPQLSEAIDIIDQIVRTSAPPSGSPTLDALIAAASEDRPGEAHLARLVRGVLRSTLEQRRTRQAREVDR